MRKNMVKQIKINFCMKIDKSVSEKFALWMWFMINMLWRNQAFLRGLCSSMKKVDMRMLIQEMGYLKSLRMQTSTECKPW